MKQVNNIFNYATKELSQDAFICWLCSYALPDSEIDSELNACAKELIQIFLQKGLHRDCIPSDIILTAVDKQVNNIDVLLSLVYEEKKYKIIIEDKTFSSEHDNQLQRYLDNIKAKDDVEAVIGVYFKTGFQSDYSLVEEAGYVVFNRKDMLSLMEKYSSIKNDIFCSYYEYWKDFDDDANEYDNIGIEEWNWRQINGAFEKIQNHIASINSWADFGWVSNKSGGFWGLWYGFYDDKIPYKCEEYSLYLQLEISWDNIFSKYNHKICSKLECSSESDNAFNEFKELILSNQNEYRFTKPSNMRKGRHMTVGVYEENATSYSELVAAIDKSIIDYEALIKKIRT